MTPELSAAVDRLAQRAGQSAVHRDSAIDHADPAKPWPTDASDYQQYAMTYAAAACIAAEAGLCDIYTALYREWATEETGRPQPTAQDYASRVRAAVEANR